MVLRLRRRGEQAPVDGAGPAVEARGVLGPEGALNLAEMRHRKPAGGQQRQVQQGRHGGALLADGDHVEHVGDRRLGDGPSGDRCLGLAEHGEGLQDQGAPFVGLLEAGLGRLEGPRRLLDGVLRLGDLLLSLVHGGQLGWRRPQRQGERSCPQPARKCWAAQECRAARKCRSKGSSHLRRGQRVLGRRQLLASLGQVVLSVLRAFSSCLASSTACATRTSADPTRS